MSFRKFSEQRYERKEGKVTVTEAKEPTRLTAPPVSTYEEQDSHGTPSSPTTKLPESFSVNGLPSPAATTQASYLPVLTEDGSSIPFGMILSNLGADEGGKETVKTIVCFIRHFFCPLCQDYMYSIGDNVNPETLERAGIRLIIVGNGGWQMIKSYQRIFKLSYAVYTDPTAALYSALGMTLRTVEAGPKRPSSSSGFGSGSYIRHDKLLSGISLVLRNAVKARMPLWRYMGDKGLLGGEFVFVKPPGKDLECVWAHRMRFTTAHEDIVNVVSHAQERTGEKKWGDEDCSPSGTTTSLGSSCSFCEPTLRVTFDLIPRVRKETASSVRESIEITTDEREWSQSRDRQLWLLKERKRWRRLVGRIGENNFVDFETVDLLEDESKTVQKGSQAVNDLFR